MTNKFNVLSFLRKNPGSWISGEELSSSFNISRAAINKHIQMLRETGYTIESQTNKGYKYINSPDKMFPEEIQNNLKSEVFGKKIYYFDSIDSTNAKARELAEKGEPEGTVVISESQQKGKGRRGREWFSPPFQGMYASLILRPLISPSKAFQINYIAAVALTESLITLTGLPLSIKWPNDILCNRKKIAGILTEMSADAESVHYLICGCGLNVHTKITDFDALLKDRASSLFIETGKRFSRVEITQRYFETFEQLYDEYIRNDFSRILNRWKALCTITGKEVTVDTGFDIVRGTVDAIDDEGILMLRNKNGEIKKLYSGDIEIVK